MLAAAALSLAGCISTISDSGVDSQGDDDGSDVFDAAGQSEGQPDAGPAPCEPIPGVSYATIGTFGNPSSRAAEEHADLNIKVRGWEPTGGQLGLVDIAPVSDPNAPRLYSIFSDDRIPEFKRNYAVYQWDWSTNTRSDELIDLWEVTMVGVGSVPGEIVELPRNGYDIGLGLQSRLLYADESTVTFKVGVEDNVRIGYTIHIVGVCVEPTLLDLYQDSVAGGRLEMPALAGDQPFGRARAGEIKMSIRDSGTLMETRSKNDWWQP